MIGSFALMQFMLYMMFRPEFNGTNWIKTVKIRKIWMIVERKPGLSISGVYDRLIGKQS